MDMVELIEPDRVIARLRAPDNPRLLTELARRASLALGLSADAILEALDQREALGSTGIGHGIAIPHARLAGLSHPFGLFARLEHPIDFAAIDGAPVDLVFLLLTPAAADKAHLAALACVSRRLRDRAFAEGLRTVKDGRTLYDRLASPAAVQP